MSSQLCEHTTDHAHADRLAAALALAEDLDGDSFDSVSGTHDGQCRIERSAARVSLPKKRAKYARRLAAERRRRKQPEQRKHDDVTAHDLDAAAIRRAEQQMQRARDAVLRGDTYRSGGRNDAPTDRVSDVERQQSREYIKRKQQG